MSGPIKCSILGAGLSLQAFHYPFIATYPELFTLHSVLERSATPTKSAARDFTGIKGLKVVNTLEEVTGDDEVELVIISTPNLSHFDYAKQCLTAGKHVLIEKPLTPTHAEAVELVNLAKEKNVILAPFQNRRWDADFLAVKGLLKEEKLGQLLEFTSHFNRFRPQPVPNTWKEAPGQLNDAIYNLGSHLIDQALVLFGKPEKVGGWCYNLRAPEGLDDSFLLHMYYPRSHPLSKPYPLLVTLQASIICPGSKQLRYQIKGNKGLYTKYGLDIQEATLRKVDWKTGPAEDVTPVGKEGWGVESEEAAGDLELVKEDGSWEAVKHVSPAGEYQTLYKSLHESIRTGKGRDALLVKPEEAALVIKVIELGMRASKEGKVLDWEE